jgi:hypothetical protein
MKQEIIATYIRLTLEKNETPASVYLFCKEMAMEEKEFYNYFSSLSAVEDGIFLNWFEQVKAKVEASEVYNSYSVREKFLAFFFAWFEELRGQRSYVNHLYHKHKQAIPSPKQLGFLNGMRKDFTSWAQHLLNEGMSAKEIEDRKFLSNKYGDAIWLDLLFVTDFWLKDKSPGFEKTDEAIERSLNLAFDLMGKSPLDSMLEFGKFLFQNK